MNGDQERAFIRLIDTGFTVEQADALARGGYDLLGAVLLHPESLRESA